MDYSWARHHIEALGQCFLASPPKALKELQLCCDDNLHQDSFVNLFYGLKTALPLCKSNFYHVLLSAARAVMVYVVRLRICLSVDLESFNLQCARSKMRIWSR